MKAKTQLGKEMKGWGRAVSRWGEPRVLGGLRVIPHVLFNNDNPDGIIEFLTLCHVIEDDDYKQKFDALESQFKNTPYTEWVKERAYGK